jgi:hypothetical protein
MIEEFIKIDWVTDLSLLATLLTAIATLKTVREMKRQREQSNMPDIVFNEEMHYKAYAAEDTDSQYFYWFNNDGGNHVFEKRKHHLFEIDCFNIGLGSAKNVMFSYEINSETFRVFLQSVNNLTFKNLDLTSDAPGFSADVGGRPVGISVLKSDLTVQKVFIPQKTDSAEKIKLPLIYLYIYDSFLQAIIPEGMAEYIDKFPSIYLHVSYEDIFKKAFVRIFEIKVFVYSAAPNQVGGYFTIKEKHDYHLE